ncbi:hypothetical protein ACFFOS_08960 [Nocardioides kongjuensis]|uniref:Uracil-DNA glycosylase n=1 Tax=Nocardioides kongjuensis TaxID=349522 RepID=A0A852RT14_9ACTN|nr:hypothetical protein [Nocardioides kongjuensis]NYD31054.1 uracil-DNA glycosylase [Nocardioides kongjuensis]
MGAAGAEAWVPDRPTLPRLRAAVQECRGRRLAWPEDPPVDAPPAWVLATTHPSAVLRARDQRQAAYDGLVADLRLAVGWLSR